MSEENVEVVRRWYECGGDARPEALRERFAPEFEMDVTAFAPDFGIVRGYEAAEEALRTYWGMFEAFRYEIEQVIHADEELVVTRARDGGRMIGGEAELWNVFFHVWTFRDRKIVRGAAFLDRDQALEAAGLSE
jgi:ketosteroid isomerase-like protein